MMILATVACANPGPTQTPLASPAKTIVTLVATHMATHTATHTALPSATVTALPTVTASPTTTPTNTPTPTPTVHPEPLPVFSFQALRPGVEPQAYLDDACFYLQRRWSLDGNPPGAVVVPIMFHSIVQPGRTISDPKDISADQFQAFVQYAHHLGFGTITTAQLLAFLETNAPIPPRSMLMILDDRRPGVVRDHFMPVLQENDWTLTLAYIADPNLFRWSMGEVARLNESGRLDIQSHGYSGDLYIVDRTSPEEIQAEIWESTPILESRFNQRPIAFIWPGGNFTSLAIQIARQGGYQLGFTAYSRGPILFNWIPLGEPERNVQDPLMVLPRAWSNSAAFNLDQALRASQQAVQDARDHYALEAEYYQTYCGGTLPPLDQILPEASGT